MEENQKLTLYQQYEQEIEQENIATALKSKNADEQHITRRLEQIHELRRRHQSDPTLLNQMQQERESYLSAAGPLDPWLLLEQMGFTTLHGKGGIQSILKVEGAEINFSVGYHAPTDKMELTFIKDGGQTYDSFPLPKTVDDIYKIIGAHSLPIYQQPSYKAKYESSYVKLLKSKK